MAYLDSPDKGEYPIRANMTMTFRKGGVNRLIFIATRCAISDHLSASNASCDSRHKARTLPNLIVRAAMGV